MGSLPDKKDCGVPMDTSQSDGNNTEKTDDRNQDSTTPKATNTSCNTVIGAENSTVTESTVIGSATNCSFIQGEKNLEGFSCNITEGAKPKLKISVPAEDGGTLIHVDCTNGRVRHWSYCRNVDIEKTFGSTWTFGNIFDGFMAAIINGKIGDSFFDLIGKWVERYDCKLYKVYKKCLVIEFLHETEEGRNKMIKEQDTVRQMFQNFMESITSNTPNCTLEVKENETLTSSGKPDAASKFTEQAVNLTSAATSEHATTVETFETFRNQERDPLSRFSRMAMTDTSAKYSDYGSDQLELEYYHHTSAKDSGHGSDQMELEFMHLPDSVDDSDPDPVLQVHHPKDSGHGSDQMDLELMHRVVPASTPLRRGRRRVFLDSVDDSDPDPAWHVHNLADSGHVSHPVPLSKLPELSCRSCVDVCHDHKDDLSAFENVFFIHLDFYFTFIEETRYQLSKILSALRNSHVGVLIVHGFRTYQFRDFHAFLTETLGLILGQDVDPCEVFKTQKIRNHKYMIRVDVEPSEMFVTLDYKTKFTSSSTDEFINASNEKVRHLLFSSRTTESTNAALQGISSQEQNLGAVRLYCHRPYIVSSDTLLDSLVEEMAALSVPEHISALSKKRGGGTIYVVMSQLIFDEITPDMQQGIKDHLIQALKKKLWFQKNKHSKVSLQDFGLLDTALSKNTKTGGYIIEIAVGHVNGCVFYDPKGPESYKIEKDRVVRLPFEEWIKEAFE